MSEDPTEPDPTEPPVDLRRPPPPRTAAEQLVAWRARLPLDRRTLAGGVALLVVLAVVAWALRPPAPAAEETVPKAQPAPGAAPVAVGSGGPTATATTGPAGTAASTPTEVVAHAAGAVVRPGVYRLGVMARVDDLVRAAGGLTDDADAARVNLAAPLADGSLVYVPRVGEQQTPTPVGPDGPVPGSAATPGPGSASSAGPNGPAGSDDPTSAAPVNLNTASEAELETLPGVGPATALAIVEYRTESGGFRSVDELLDVRGIGEAKLAQLRDLVIV